MKKIQERIKSYRIAPKCCATCHYIFERHAWSASTYFCTRGAKNRPICMSGVMGEVLGDNEAAREELAQARWNKWAIPRKIDPWFVCDLWEERYGNGNELPIVR